MAEDLKQPEFETCPCCKEKTLKRPIKVSTEIVEHYMACIMTGIPFNHTFPLYGGRIQVKITDHSREDGLFLYKFLIMLEPVSDVSVKIKDLIGLVNTYAVVETVFIKQKEDDENVQVFKPSSIILERCKQLMDTWAGKDIRNEESEDRKAFVEALKQLYIELSSPSVISAVPPAILARVIGDFHAIDSILMEAGFDENFWKGIELV